MRVNLRYETATGQLLRLDRRLYLLSNVNALVKGQGHGTGLMQMAIDYADKHDCSLTLMVQASETPERGALTNEQLEEFYGKFGFERKGFSRPLPMWRTPRKNYAPYSEKQE